MVITQRSQPCFTHLGRLWACCAVLGLCALFAAHPSLAQSASPRLSIVSPSDEETVHSNTGQIAVVVSLGGATLRGDQAIRILLDGEPAAEPARSTEVTIETLVRGPHSLEAQIVDRAGTVLSSSEPVNFYLWRASVNLPNR